MPAAALKPALMPARLAAMAAGPLSTRRFLIGANACSAVKTSSRLAMPSAIMLGRPSGMALANSFIGTSTTRAPDSVTIGGKSPPRGSLITRVCGPALISAPKRWAFSQSMPTRRSNRSGRDSTGSTGQAERGPRPRRRGSGGPGCG